MRVLRNQAKRISSGGRGPTIRLASKGPTMRSRSNSPPSDSEEFETVEIHRISTGGWRNETKEATIASKGRRRVTSSSGKFPDEESIGRISTGGNEPRMILASKGPRHISRSPSPEVTLESTPLKRYRPGLEVKRHIRNYYYKSCFCSGDSSANRTKTSVTSSDVKLARRIRGELNYFYL